MKTIFLIKLILLFTLDTHCCWSWRRHSWQERKQRTSKVQWVYITMDVCYDGCLINNIFNYVRLRWLSTMEIDLSKQSLAKLPDDLVKHANLKVLNLSTNRLTSIPTFGTLLISKKIDLKYLWPLIVQHSRRW